MAIEKSVAAARRYLDHHEPYMTVEDRVPAYWVHAMSDFDSDFAICCTCLIIFKVERGWKGYVIDESDVPFLCDLNLWTQWVVAAMVIENQIYRWRNRFYKNNLSALVFPRRAGRLWTIVILCRIGQWILVFKVYLTAVFFRITLYPYLTNLCVMITTSYIIRMFSAQWCIYLILFPFECCKTIDILVN